MINGSDRLVTALIISTRWLMGLLYLGLIVVLIGVLAEFAYELVHTITRFGAIESAQFVVAALKLIDLVLMANLIVILISAGLDTLLSEGPDRRLGWMGKVDFAAIKLKLFALIAAIAAIDLLETFVNVNSMNKTDVLWEILIFLSFVVAGVMLAFMDRIGAEPHD